MEKHLLLLTYSQEEDFYIILSNVGSSSYCYGKKSLDQALVRRNGYPFVQVFSSKAHQFQTINKISSLFTGHTSHWFAFIKYSPIVF